MTEYLVVGAGFAGAVYARTLAEAGCAVQVIDQRAHIGGNVYDYVDANGIRIHKYGPHILHTTSSEVVNWLSRFTEWENYEHRVKAILPSGIKTPLPLNRTTINDVYGLSLSTAKEVEDFLKSVAEPLKSPSNAAEYLYSKIGSKLTNLFYRPYTKKMWALDLEEISESVVRRIPLRMDTEDRYFPDASFQLMPKEGYSKIFERIFSHPNISVSLNVSFDKSFEANYQHIFNSMAIDEYFDSRFGPLPYRSIKFHMSTIDAQSVDATTSVQNYTDETRFTRETFWHLFAGHLVNETGRRTKTVEEPCDYLDNNMERYYPVKTADGRFHDLYLRYRQEAELLPNMTFIGRCGTYQYLDMDQVINQSMKGIEKFLRAHPVQAQD